VILADDSQRAAIRAIRSHVTRPFWLRRPSARFQCQVTYCTNDVIARVLVGTAWYARYPRTTWQSQRPRQDRWSSGFAVAWAAAMELEAGSGKAARRARRL